MASTAGYIIATSCHDIIEDQHWLTSSYILFAVPYFVYDIYAMFMCYRHKQQVKGHEGSGVSSALLNYLRKEFMMVLHHVVMVTICFPVSVMLVEYALSCIKHVPPGGCGYIQTRQRFKMAFVRRFLIGREKPGQTSEVAHLISQTLEQERRQREMMEQQYAQYDADDDELQIKHAVTEAEIQKLKHKLQTAESEKVRWECEKNQLKQSIEDNKSRMLQLESYWIEAQTLCHTVNEHLKETQSQYQALEKKYNKAKKLIKDFQQK
ncbi:UNVERIFIED_CONTAM: hypothetical protein FKN15_018204 [Acipenser sinensis]